MRIPVKSPCRTCKQEDLCKHKDFCASFRRWVMLNLAAAKAEARRIRKNGQKVGRQD